MRIFFTLLAIATYISLFGGNVYRDFLTGFDGFSKYADSKSGCIVIDNPNNSRIIETSKFGTKEKEFTYTIRLKSSGRKSRNRFLNSMQQHSYGIIWNYKDNENYEGIEITPTNSSYYDDITNQQSLKIEIFSMHNGDKETVRTFDIDQNDGDEESYNTFKLLFDGKTMTIEAGHRRLQKIVEIPNATFGDSTDIGYFAGKGSKLTIKRIQFSSKPVKESLYSTNYTKTELDSIFHKSNDLIEGYWKYLDRKMDENKMRLGGKYTIAIVKEKSRYRILYISGAITMPDLWKPYMTKGVLESTPFIDNYNLRWIDSQKEIIEDEGYATFSESILSINLPINGTTVRFYKLQ